MGVPFRAFPQEALSQQAIEVDAGVVLGDTVADLVFWSVENRLRHDPLSAAIRRLRKWISLSTRRFFRGGS
jgi:hypothetical protein